MLREIENVPKGLVVKVALNFAVPYILFNENVTNEIILEGGVEFQLLKILEEKYGFVYQLERPKDKEWGRYLDGRWTGMIGMVNRGEADIAVGCISLTYHRSQACDFTSAYDMDHAAIVTMLPGDKSKDYAAVMPFTFHVWLLILLTFFGNIFALFFVMRVQAAWIPTTKAEFGRIFWFFLGHLLSEGGTMRWYRNNVTRFVIGMWLIFVFIIQSSYSGTVMSFLTVPLKEKAISTLEDLAQAIKRQGFKCGCTFGTSTDEYLKDLEGELSVIPKSLFGDPKNHVTSLAVAFERVLGGKFAFIGSEVALGYVAQQLKISGIYISDQARGFDLIAMAVRKNYHYKHHLSRVISRAYETGLFQKWRREEVYSFSGSLQKQDKEITPLTLTEIKGLLIFSGYIYAMATLVLIAELLYKRSVDHRKK